MKEAIINTIPTVKWESVHIPMLDIEKELKKRNLPSPGCGELIGHLDWNLSLEDIMALSSRKG